MKNHIVFACLLINAGLAEASVQSTTSQDKPPYVYIHSYIENQSVGTSRVDTMPDSTCPISLMTSILGEGISCQWDDSGNGSYSDQSTATYNAYYRWADTWYQQMDSTTTCNWPIGLTTQIQSDEILYGGGTGEPSISTNSYTNQIVPINEERCNFSVSISLTENQAWWDWPRETQWSGSGTHFIGIQMKMQTGGRATSKQRNLIGLSGTVQQMTPPIGNYLYYCPEPFTADYTYDWLYGDPGPMVQPQNINIGANTMNTNGTAYMILPDNANVDVTPYVAGLDDYTFNLGQPQKYHSYYDVFVQQANPGYSLMPYGTEDVGHAFWRFRTDASGAALQFISASLTNMLGTCWGFYPSNGLFTVPGQLENDSRHSANIARTFYIGFSDLLNGLEFTKGISKAPPIYSLTGYNCVSAARNAGFAADVYGLPSDTSPQNFGVTLIEMYPAPGLVIGPFYDTNDIFYSSAPY
jgi:hypothetical protein